MTTALGTPSWLGLAETLQAVSLDLAPKGVYHREEPAKVLLCKGAGAKARRCGCAQLEAWPRGWERPGKAEDTLKAFFKARGLDYGEPLTDSRWIMICVSGN